MSVADHVHENAIKADLEAWAQAELHLKGVAANAEELALTQSSLHEAFARTYAGVALDIDGTLTAPGAVVLNEEAAEAIRALLRRSVYVFLATGRGKTAESALRQILGAANFSRRYSARVLCLVDNGATLLRLPIDGTEPTFEALSAFANLEAIGEWIRKSLDQLDAPATTNVRIRPGRARVTFENEANARAFLSRLEETVHQFVGDAPVHLARGAYGSLHTVDIGPTSKGTGLRRLCDRLGLRPDDVLRIADRGDPDGNDFEFLDSEAGFTVDKISPRLGVCHCVIDQAGNVLRHSQGTMRLLQLFRFSPRLTISSTLSREDILNGLLQFEREAAVLAVAARNNTYDRLAKSIGRLFSPDDAMTGSRISAEDIYDRFCGAVRMRNWEVWSSEQSPLRDLFGLDRYRFTNEPPECAWSMYSDSGVLLRGIEYYRHWGKPRLKEAERIARFICRSQEFVRGALAGVAYQAEEKPSLSGLKLLLGVMDNVRHILLQLAYLAYSQEGESESGIQADLSYILDYALPQHTSYMVKFHLANDADWVDAHMAYFDLLLDNYNMLESLLADLTHAEATSLVDEVKIFRSRECDNFLENLTAIEIGLSKHLEQRSARAADGVLVVGLVYGGIELPFLAAALSPMISWDIQPGLYGVSFYSRVTDDALGSSRPHPRGDGGDAALNLWTSVGARGRSLPTILADDNVTTARSLQHARDVLSGRGGDVIGAIAVRYPGVNRFVQMQEVDGAMPDPDVCLTFLRGMVAPAPYARLIEAKGTTGSERYLDVTGIFDKSKERIKRYLRKNYIARTE